MMEKIKYKRILGLFIFTFAFAIISVLTLKNVNAITPDEQNYLNKKAQTGADKCQYAKDKMKMEQSAKNIVGFSVNTSGKDDKNLIIKLSNTDQVKNKEFQIVRVGFYHIEEIQGVSYPDLIVTLEEAEYGSILTRGEDSTTQQQVLVEKMVFDKEFINPDDIKRILDISDTKIKQGFEKNQKRKSVNSRAGVSSSLGVAITIKPVDYKSINLVNDCEKKQRFDFQITEGVFVDDYDDMAPAVFDANWFYNKYISRGDQKNASKFILHDFNSTGNSEYSNFKDYCANYSTKYSKDSFDYKFCQDRDNAIKAGVGTEDKVPTKEEQKNYNKKEDKFNYSCDLTKTLSMDELSDDSKYYVNRNYLRGQKVKTETATYHYGTEWGDATEEITCTSTCEEIVTVEYGPPVAATSGLCFEYKIKVTSRVNCIGDIDKDRIKDKQPKAKVCTPTPQCKHSNGTVSFAAGPNAQFDSCVESCDGGKYTDKCVDKCYDKVYGKTNKKTGTNEISYAEKMSADLADGHKYQYVIYKDKNGVDRIKWDNEDERGDNQSTSYRNTHLGGGGQDYHAPNGQGSYYKDSYFHKNVLWGTNFPNSWYHYYTNVGTPSISNCSASHNGCTWGDNELCGDWNANSNVYYINHPYIYDGYDPVHPYLTDGDYLVKQRTAKKLKTTSPLEKDMEANVLEYNKLVDSCAIASSCNTKQATFSIAVKYTKLTKNSKGKWTNAQTIKTEFPYTENPKDHKPATIYDTIDSDDENDGNITCSAEATKDYKINRDWWNSIFLSYDGCYNCSKKAEEPRYYMTEWSFPGYWYKWKAGHKDVTYSGNKSGYEQSSEKAYCLPPSDEEVRIMDVNTKWWYYYQAKYNKDKTKYSINNDDYYNDIKCYDGKTLDNNCYVTRKNILNASLTIDASDFKWNEETAEGMNIWGDTTNFGYLDWNIGIQCLYAKKEGYTDENSKSKSKNSEVKDCADKCQGDSGEKRVTTIDTENVFPDKSGNKPKDSSETMRTPGWNWSRFAKMDNSEFSETSGKYTQFALESDPEALIKWIQTDANGSGIYSETNVDYAVYLTKKDINDIRGLDKSKDFTQVNFNKCDENNKCGDFVKNNVYNYRSRLLRGETSVKLKTLLPDGDTIKCNNIKSHGEQTTGTYNSGCEIIKGGE